MTARWVQVGPWEVLVAEREPSTLARWLRRLANSPHALRRGVVLLERAAVLRLAAILERT